MISHRGRLVNRRRTQEGSNMVWQHGQGDISSSEFGDEDFCILCCVSSMALEARSWKLGSYCETSVHILHERTYTEKSVNQSQVLMNFAAD